MPKVHVAEAMHQNMRQLLELYLVEESKSSTALFYKPYEGLKNMIPFLSELQDNFSKRKYDAIVSMSIHWFASYWKTLFVTDIEVSRDYRRHSERPDVFATLQQQADTYMSLTGNATVGRLLVHVHRGARSTDASTLHT